MIDFWASDMFDAIGKEVALRILEGRLLLSVALSDGRPGDVGDKTKRASAVCKGLLFVQLYGAYEYAVSSSVRAALDGVKTGSMSCSEMRPSLLSLVLHSQWISASEVGRNRRWDRRLELIRSMDDEEPIVDLSDTLFPHDGSHYREGQLATIWRVFGIGVPTLPELRLRGRIEEVVDNRNSIAHGRRTPGEVGGRYSEADMNERIADIDAIAHYVIDAMKVHCESGGLTSSGP